MDRKLAGMLIGLGSIGWIALLVSQASPGVASAHGKEMTIEVSGLTPNTQQPLARLYQAGVAYTGDKEPVEGVVIELTARRQQTGEILTPVRLIPLNSPGYYAAQVTFPRYGVWEIRVQAAEPGSGEASFVDEILPPVLLRQPQSGGQGEQKSIFSVTQGFNWRDMANLGIRWIHSLAAVVWFGLSILIVSAFWLLDSPSRAQFLRRLNSLFPWLAWASLAFLAATGVYNSIYNSPIRSPGAFSFFVMERIPYGAAYLVALGLKVIAVGMGIALALSMARGLKSAVLSEGGDPIQVKNKRYPPLLSLAAVNLAVGVIMMLSVSVLIYLHNLSHLAVLVPGR